MTKYETIRADYPPQRVENQQQFDRKMNQLRTAQADILAPLKERSDRLNDRRHEIGRKLAELNIELGNINREREDIRNECREIGSIFYALKKELIRLNPKAAPPTATENHAED